ncbi:MFS transporter [Natronorarus salvus]|uniref:MFS transporter n=1 Tax=Natronorarus salvus TaxID=3117733 RepID=UPI002F261410
MDAIREEPRGFGVRFGPHLAAFSVGYVVFSYASVPGVVMAEFGVGFTAVGLLMSAALASFVAVQLIGGRLVDDRPTLPVLLGVVVVNAALAVALDLSTTFSGLIVLRGLWGFAGGLAVTVCATQISRVYTGSTATWHQSVNGGMFTFGGASSFVVTPAVVGTTGWFGVHAVGALVALPAIVALWVDRRAAGETAPTGQGVRSPAGPETPRFATLRNRLVLLAAVCNVATLGAYITLSTFVTSYFDDVGVIGPLNAIALLVASLGRVGGGVAILRPGLDDGHVIAAASGAGAVGLFLIVLVGDGSLLVVFLPLLALAAVSLPFGAIFKITAGASRRDGTAVAIVVAAGNGAAIVLPAVTGRLRDLTGGYDGAFVLLALVNAVAACAGIAIARRT